jgi:alanine dehydrogenase
MRPGSVLVDIAVDQGGCFESTRPTTHAAPTFAVHDAVFYCVANMPGAVPVTSTHALTNVTLPYLAALASDGWRAALAADPALAAGLSTHAGGLFHAGVGAAHGLPVADTAALLA